MNHRQTLPSVSVLGDRAGASGEETVRPPATRFPSRVIRRPFAGFSLLELLIVMGIIILLAALLVPAFSSINKGNQLTLATATISGLVQQARSYAMANNTYVYLGIGEFDADVPTNAKQTPAAGNKGGRVAVGVVATRDGTRGYSPYATSIETEWKATASKTGDAAALVELAKPERFDNVHIIDFPEPPPAEGTMARPEVSDDFCRLGSSASATATEFSCPLSANGAKGYTFSRVIQFDPQGVARVISAGMDAFKAAGVPAQIEIAFQPSNGSIVPEPPASQTEGNHSVVQIDGLTGSVNTYRP